MRPLISRRRARGISRRPGSSRGIGRAEGSGTVEHEIRRCHHGDGERFAHDVPQAEHVNGQLHDGGVQAQAGYGNESVAGERGSVARGRGESPSMVQERKKLAGYMLRAPMSLAKMTYDAATGTVIYRSKMHLSLKRNFQVMPGAGWLELLCRHIPDRYELVHDASQPWLSFLGITSNPDLAGTVSCSQVYGSRHPFCGTSPRYVAWPRMRLIFPRAERGSVNFC